MQLIKTLFCSMKMVLLLMALYALACAIATFVEKFYGTLAARFFVYDAFWFEILHLWLACCLLGCFITSKAWQRRKYASLLLHGSFLVIIIGAGITRYYGFEGLMSIREGESAKDITTSARYIFIQVRNPQGQTESVRIPAYIDDKMNNPIKQNITFFDKPLRIETGALEQDSSMAGMGGMGGMGGRALHASVKFLDKDFQVLIKDHGDGKPTKESINAIHEDGYSIVFAWGADVVSLPFSLKLTKFELERYPGSNSPASYASEVEVLDEGKPAYPFRIFMNHVLDYSGYRFFQSSYFPDEKGTILSVNNDPGKLPTYIGYTMLILGVLWLLFDKHGRFMTLGRFLKTQQFFSLVLVCTLCFFALPTQSFASPDNAESAPQDSGFPPQPQNEGLQDIPAMVKALQGASHISKQFDRILVQDFGGRTKPIHTLADEYIHKITQRSSFLDLNPTQILLGMIFYPQEWQSIQMIAVKTPKLKQILGVSESQKYIAYIDVFGPQGQYILQNYVEAANLKNPALRDTFEKDVISVDERINYAFLIYTGQVLRIFPDSKAPNHQWFYPLEAISSAVAQGDMARAKQLMGIFKLFAKGMQEGLDSAEWQEAHKALDEIATFQKENGGATLIDGAKVDSEIWLNQYNPFHQLVYPYLIISIVLFIIVLYSILKNSPVRVLTHKVFYALLLLLFILHTLGLALRWYVSEHAPWSNAYESMLYIAWASILSGVVFFRHSNLALSASSFMAGITLFVAHLGFMDPQIGNLVPVLKSYWLNIHVSVITASYGFLGLCFILGLITLLMFVIRNDTFIQTEQTKERVDSSILSLSALNEMAMILGLFLLTVGNFLGGVWANESWGRYWGWDSKETWALISIGVYAIILHLRFVVKRNFPFVFASSSVVGFFSILMTYFGVNFYLTGMHSYAAGEAMPVPLWVKIMVGSIFVFILVAGRNRQLDMPRLS